VDLPRCDLMDRRRAFIQGDYKLISFGDNQLLELYKVNEDFAETRELSKSDPERLEAMKRDYLAFIADIPNTPVVGSAPLKGAPPGQRW
jgi:arylsulfatase A-like enzyme